MVRSEIFNIFTSDKRKNPTAKDAFCLSSNFHLHGVCLWRSIRTRQDLFLVAFLSLPLGMGLGKILAQSLVQ